MTILNEIIEHKRKEIKALDDFETLNERIKELLEDETLPLTKGFSQALREAEGPALIAEIKKASPSKGIIREDFDVIDIANSYSIGGAHCFSVLTDNKYFKGSYENLIMVASEMDKPALCKEFIIDARQVAQARISGADAILLIAKALNDDELQALSSLAYDYGMDVLLEVHNEEEMQRAIDLDFDLIGINNRNLETFETSLDTSSKLLSKFKYDLEGKVLVSESGIKDKKDILILYNMGAKAFLVGESLLRQENLVAAVSELIA